MPVPQMVSYNVWWVFPFSPVCAARRKLLELEEQHKNSSFYRILNGKLLEVGNLVDWERVIF
jgi:hypothetical protein